MKVWEGLERLDRIALSVRDGSWVQPEQRFVRVVLDLPEPTPQPEPEPKLAPIAVLSRTRASINYDELLEIAKGLKL